MISFFLWWSREEEEEGDAPYLWHLVHWFYLVKQVHTVSWFCPQLFPTCFNQTSFPFWWPSPHPHPSSFSMRRTKLVSSPPPPCRGLTAATPLSAVEASLWTTFDPNFTTTSLHSPEPFGTLLDLSFITVFLEVACWGIGCGLFEFQTHGFGDGVSS